jgi:hypothetical protein
MNDPFLPLMWRGLANWSHSRRTRTQDRKDIKLDICGEHGGDPASIQFFNEVGAWITSPALPTRADRTVGGGAGDDQERLVILLCTILENFRGKFSIELNARTGELTLAKAQSTPSSEGRDELSGRNSLPLFSDLCGLCVFARVAALPRCHQREW